MTYSVKVKTNRFNIHWADDAIDSLYRAYTFDFNPEHNLGILSELLALEACCIYVTIMYILDALTDGISITPHINFEKILIFVLLYAIGYVFLKVVWIDTRYSRVIKDKNGWAVIDV